MVKYHPVEPRALSGYSRSLVLGQLLILSIECKKQKSCDYILNHYTGSRVLTRLFMPIDFLTKCAYILCNITVREE